jgi:hypothetical protein
MRTAFLCAAMALLVAASAAMASEPWHRHYERGLEHIQEGRGTSAIEALERALALKEGPELRAVIEGARYVDYLPHLYLAIAHHMAGDPGAARSRLRLSMDVGMAAQSAVGGRLLEAYAHLLGVDEDVIGPREPQAEPPAQAPSRLPTYRDFDPRPPVLTESELEEVKREVLSRCGLTSSRRAAQLPWYYHWELGLELARRGDPQRALDALLVAAQRRGESRRGARMYGMWFTDYLPYFQIARLHVELGNWHCAADALRRSQEKGEVPPTANEYPELLELLDEVRAQTGLRNS